MKTGTVVLLLLLVLYEAERFIIFELWVSSNKTEMNFLMTQCTQLQNNKRFCFDRPETENLKPLLSFQNTAIWFHLPEILKKLC